MVELNILDQQRQDHGVGSIDGVLAEVVAELQDQAESLATPLGKIFTGHPRTRDSHTEVRYSQQSPPPFCHLVYSDDYFFFLFNLQIFTIRMSGLWYTDRPTFPDYSFSLSLCSTYSIY